MNYSHNISKYITSISPAYRFSSTINLSIQRSWDLTRRSLTRSSCSTHCRWNGFPISSCQVICSRFSYIYSFLHIHIYIHTYIYIYIYTYVCYISLIDFHSQLFLNCSEISRRFPWNSCHVPC